MMKVIVLCQQVGLQNVKFVSLHTKLYNIDLYIDLV